MFWGYDFITGLWMSKIQSPSGLLQLWSSSVKYCIAVVVIKTTWTSSSSWLWCTCSKKYWKRFLCTVIEVLGGCWRISGEGYQIWSWSTYGMITFFCLCLENLTSLPKNADLKLSWSLRWWKSNGLATGMVCPWGWARGGECLLPRVCQGTESPGDLCLNWKIILLSFLL